MPPPWGPKETELRDMILCDQFPADWNEQVRRLDSISADEPYRGTGGRTSLLFYSVIKENFDCFCSLVQNDADIEWRNDRGANVMQLIAKRGLVAYAKVCLVKMMHRQDRTNEEKLNRWLEFVNRGNNEGWTPLMAAAVKQHVDMFKWLIACKAHPTYVMGNNYTSAHAVYRGGSLELGEFILKHLKEDIDKAAKAKNRYSQKTYTANDINPDFEMNVKEHMIRKESELEQEIEDFRRKKGNTPGKKCLMVHVSIIDFDPLMDNVDRKRKGAENDVKLVDDFEKYFECETICRKIETRADFRRLVAAVQKRMSEESSPDLLFWYIGSHGATRDGEGFIMDRHWREIGLERDPLSKFSPQQCPAMKNKHAVFFIDACRDPLKRAFKDEDANECLTPIVHSAVGSRLLVYSTEPCQLSLRFSGERPTTASEEGSEASAEEAKGTFAVEALRKVIETYKDTLPLPEFFRKTQSKMEEMSQESKYLTNFRFWAWTQQIPIDSRLSEDFVYFMRKR